MENKLYTKTIHKDYDIEHLTLMDFIEVCDKLELPVFGIDIRFNPFVEPHRAVSNKVYRNMSEYRKTMPSWSARAYDYEMDRASHYLEYPDISKGKFEVRADNSHSDYHWCFEVVGECVVAHCAWSITD